MKRFPGGEMSKFSATVRDSSLSFPVVKKRITKNIYLPQPKTFRATVDILYLLTSYKVSETTKASKMTVKSEGINTDKISYFDYSSFDFVKRREKNCIYCLEF